jgi:16S rRNA A1518/A1519 N6-dimethyltransferase RsmA/KsgA/DIM1 with predicted DNA glycosylase/AP lyase activity
MATRKHLYSQHFLRDQRLALFLIGHTNIKRRDTVLEIGAGSGVLTSALLKRAARVIAVENERDAYEKLRRNLGNRPGLKLAQGDFLEFDLGRVEGDYKICANPPFAISSEILRKINGAKHKPKAVYLILQKQFAERVLDRQGGANSELGREVARNFTSRIRYVLNPRDFTPPPAVPTVLLELKLREGEPRVDDLGGEREPAK